MTERAAGFIIFRKITSSIEYLLLQTSYGSHHWTPPKGHIESGEDDLTTAYRETQEEAGLEKQHLHVYNDVKFELNYVANDKPKTCIYWLAKLIDAEAVVRLSHEHQHFKWLPYGEAHMLAYYKDFQDVLTKCNDFLKSA